MSTRYQQLEQQIQTLQEEHQKQIQKLQELQKEVELLNKEEQESKLPEGFAREVVLEFLKNPYLNCSALSGGFVWSKTTQGCSYWRGIQRHLESDKNYQVPSQAIIQLQKWVIQSYQKQYGLLDYIRT